MTQPEHGTRNSAAAQPSGPGATGGLPGENSDAEIVVSDDELADTTLAGNVAPPGPSDAR